MVGNRRTHARSVTTSNQSSTNTLYHEKYFILKLHYIFSIYSQKEIAENLVKENGKTMADAEGDVLRGLRKYHIKRLDLCKLDNSLFN